MTRYGHRAYFQDKNDPLIQLRAEWTGFYDRTYAEEALEEMIQQVMAGSENLKLVLSACFEEEIPQ